MEESKETNFARNDGWKHEKLEKKKKKKLKLNLYCVKPENLTFQLYLVIAGFLVGVEEV